MMVTGAHRSAEAALWWRAYSKSIQDRRGSHPTTEAEARIAREAADKAVAESNGADGTPEHLRMGLTKKGDGPVLSEDDPDFDHWGCWCGTPGCDKYEGSTK